jgi:hypothetical protein
MRNVPDSLECLVLASVNALNDETAVCLIDMIRQKRKTLKKLVISDNKMNSASNYQVVRSIIEGGESAIEDLDLSKCKLEGNF